MILSVSSLWILYEGDIISEASREEGRLSKGAGGGGGGGGVVVVTPDQQKELLANHQLTSQV